MRSRFWAALAVGGVAVVMAWSAAPGVAAPAGQTVLVSVAGDGRQADSTSYGSSLSEDGRYVAFTSFAGNLVPGDRNDRGDVFVHDRRTGGTERVSVAADGTELAAGAWQSAISGDGRYVAFTAWPSEQGPLQTHGWYVCVRDRWAATTTVVSVTSGGVAADNSSEAPAISADGRYVVFQSLAANLDGSDNSWYGEDVFVRDLWQGTTTRVSVTPAGAGGNGRSMRASISDDGRYVAFFSFATDLTADGSTRPGVFVRDLRTGVTTRASLTSGGAAADRVGDGRISGNGRFVAFYTDAADVVAGDTNRTFDVFVRDLSQGTTTRVSVATGGVESDDDSFSPALSRDGRYIVFASYATNLVPGDGNDANDVFIHDQLTGTTHRVSVSRTGGDADSESNEPSISASGGQVGFHSFARNLVPRDINDVDDIFVRSGCPDQHRRCGPL